MKLERVNPVNMQPIISSVNLSPAASSAELPVFCVGMKRNDLVQ